MVKIVKCIVCGKNVKTYGSQFFVHCGHRQPITESNWINKPNNSLLQNREGSEEALNESLKSEATLESAEAVSSNSNIQELEIEDDEPENPLENLPEEKKEFHCPNCNNQLNEYETPCPRCFYEIEWR
jgi:endogenous inhibitor of DNA gyrase (YacG/DUF329 family)